MMRTLSIVPVGLLSFTYDVMQEGVAVGSIENRAAFLQIKGALASRGKRFVTSREGAFRASYSLETAEGALVARAVKVPSLSEEYDISFGERNIRLKKKALSMRETFIISDGSGGIGSIVQESLMSRRLRCETDSNESEIPQEIMLFLAWLALIIRKKDAASAG
jgi:hypothetical protein